MNDAPKARTRLRRLPDRGRYAAPDVAEILDAGTIAHVGYRLEDGVFVTPTAYWHDGERLFWHGSAASRMIRAARTDGLDVCVTVTLLDGIVLARSQAHMSFNYRSVMAFGRARTLAGLGAKRTAMRTFVERMAPGRAEEARPPTDDELRAIDIAWIALDEASAKLRVGPPTDDAADYALPIWAGVVPIAEVRGAPIRDAARTQPAR
jgi:nitroimidazol reductase NimA-like FMN-containing flavoprotein (pyridoxamine 5'-phosphate oxidase superfamily)